MCHIAEENHYGRGTAASLYSPCFLLQSNVHCKVLCTTTERLSPPASVWTASVGTARCSAEGLTLKKLVLALVVQKKSSLQFQASAVNSVPALTIVLKAMIVMPTLLVLIFRQLILAAAMTASLELTVAHVQVRTALLVLESRWIFGVLLNLSQILH